MTIMACSPVGAISAKCTYKHKYKGQSHPFIIHPDFCPLVTDAYWFLGTMDCLEQFRQKSGLCILSVGWNLWNFLGMMLPPPSGLNTTPLRWIGLLWVLSWICFSLNMCWSWNIWTSTEIVQKVTSASSSSSAAAESQNLRPESLNISCMGGHT